MSFPFREREYAVWLVLGNCKGLRGLLNPQDLSGLVHLTSGLAAGMTDVPREQMVS